MSNASFGSRLLRALGNLFLAMLNATLLLIAVCLLLGVILMGRVNDLSDTLASSLIKVEPLRTEVSATKDEIIGLRSDLNSLRNSGDEVSQAVSARIDARINRIESRIESLTGPLENIAGAPQQLVATAAQTMADEAAALVTRFSGCIPAPRAQQAELPPASQ